MNEDEVKVTEHDGVTTIRTLGERMDIMDDDCDMVIIRSYYYGTEQIEHEICMYKEELPHVIVALAKLAGEEE